MAVFFFFQAEDGIRDLTVTGVQTCALPICTPPDMRRCMGTPRGWWSAKVTRSWRGRGARPRGAPGEPPRRPSLSKTPPRGKRPLPPPARNKGNEKALFTQKRGGGSETRTGPPLIGDGL